MIRRSAAALFAGMILTAQMMVDRPAAAAGADAETHAPEAEPSRRCDPIYEPKSRRLAATTAVGDECRKTGLYHLIVGDPAACGRSADGRPLMRFGYLDESGKFRPAFDGCFRRFEDAHRREAARSHGGVIDARQPFWIE